MDLVIIRGYISAMTREPFHRAGLKGPENMQMYRMPIRAVFYRDHGQWFAHCLEMDLIGEGATREDALAQLDAAIKMQVDASIECNNFRNLIQPADGKYFAMFFAGKNFAVGQLKLLKIRAENVEIDEIEAREYDTAAAPDCALA